MSEGKSQQGGMSSSIRLSLSELGLFLWKSPYLFNFTFDDAAKRAILEQCYSALWQNDAQIMQEYFYPDHDIYLAAIDRLVRQRRITPDAVDPRDFEHMHEGHLKTLLLDKPTQRCGRVFRKGEAVYRCRNCGFDDTCVLCSKCFHASDHENHDVFVSISPGSGGCCDCSDPESWKVPMICAIHGVTGPVEDESLSSQEDEEDDDEYIPRHVLDSVRQTIGTALEFMLQVFAISPEEIALQPENLSIARWNENENQLFRRLGIPLGDSVKQDEDVDMGKETTEENRANKENRIDGDHYYACVAWNDESHSFTHVCETIMRAIRCSYQETRRIVDTMHNRGREIIATSSNPEELRALAAPLAAINLGVTIRPARDVFREQVSALLIDWLLELAQGPVKLNHDGTMQSCIVQELCAPWELPQSIADFSVLSPHLKFFPDEDDDEIEKLKGEGISTPAAAETGIATGTVDEDVEMFDNEGQSRADNKSNDTDSDGWGTYHNYGDIASIDWEPAPMIKEYRRIEMDEHGFTARLRRGLSSEPYVHDEEETRRLAYSIQREFEEKQRLDYMMLFDLRLWKEVRISLRELYIMTLGSRPGFKKLLGKRLVRNYARLAESFLFRDREPENAIILFSVQLLTVPSVASLLVNEYYFFGLICSTLAAFFMTEHIYYLTPGERPELPTRLNCESRAFRTRRYFNAFHDLRYILNVNLLKPVIAQNPVYLRQFLDLIMLFQAMNPQICQKDTHVEYESEVWVNAFNVTLQIAKCCRCFSDCYNTLPISTREDQIQSAQTLIRALARVLHAIDTWGWGLQEKVPGENNKQVKPVPATSDCKYHTVTLPHVGEIRVIEYDVASDPVSFHHPLHWLLAGILEASSWMDRDILRDAGWPEDFAQAITLFRVDRTSSPSETEEILLPILDFPIRTLAFCSQIRTGVWVRNGYNIRNQVHHYRDISLRETTYDSDVFLLQLAFITIDPNRVLATLMDRFNLTQWFLGQLEHPHYDSSQTVFMVEEVLYLLILCVSERANATHMSIHDRIERELVHHLCLGPTVYSDLTKRIPERLTEHPDFDKILNRVAKYKAPVSLSDSGRYELKDEYFDQVDPYFWHYSRNNRGEAEKILKGRLKDSKSEFLRPRLVEIMHGPFRDLTKLLHAPVLAQMIAYSLHNVKKMSDNHKSDTVLDETLHLLLLAVTEQYGQNEFFRYASENRYTFEDNDGSKRDMTLFDILTIFLEDEEYKETHARIEWILGEFEKQVPSLEARAMVADYMEKRRARAADASASAEQSDKERKKQAAKERQQKIMAMFAQAQSAFMEQNEDLYDEEEEENWQDGPFFGDDIDVDRICAYPTGTCIVCQEDVNERSMPYGMLGLIQVSNILREVPGQESEMMFRDMMAMGARLNCEWPDRQLTQSPSCGWFPMGSHKSGLHASTCGHLMHIKCFDVYCASIDSRHAAQLTRNHPENRVRKEFTCPLCKSLGNILLPVIWRGKKEVYPGVLANSDDDSYNRFLQTDIHTVAEELQFAIDPSKAFGYGIWGSRGDILFAPRLPSLRSNSGSRQSPQDMPRNARIPGLATLLGAADNEHQQQLQIRNRLGPPEMLHKTALAVWPVIQESYTRLGDVMSVILDACGSTESSRSLSLSVRNLDILWGLLGYTITASEIAIRGMAPSSDANSLYDQIPSQSQMLLRILSDTILAYTNVMCQSEQGPAAGSLLFQMPPSTADSSVMIQVHKLALQRLLQIFAAGKSASIDMTMDPMLFDSQPLLTDDPFMILSELSVHLVPVTKANMYPFIRVLLVAELTKAAIGLQENKHIPYQVIQEVQFEESPEEISAARSFRMLLARKRKTMQQEQLNDAQFCRLLKVMALPFLRRTMILMTARFGFTAATTTPPGRDEFNELAQALRLPDFSTLLLHPENEPLVGAWCDHLAKENMHPVLDLPTPLFLVSLPPRLDQLMDESMRRICPRCRSVPTDPALCLLCGALVCSQSFCCSEGEEGECNIHMMDCGGEIGIYLLIKRCSLLVLHNENGWFMQAPYLDTHGEVDQGLRRGRPQYLNAKRYADIRKLWLQHGIPAYVARQIEATFDIGGWTTL